VNDSTSIIVIVLSMGDILFDEPSPLVDEEMIWGDDVLNIL
jgi:hypothetical protein